MGLAEVTFKLYWWGQCKYPVVKALDTLSAVVRTPDGDIIWEMDWFKPKPLRPLPGAAPSHMGTTGDTNTAKSCLAEQEDLATLLTFLTSNMGYNKLGAKAVAEYIMEMYPSAPIEEKIRQALIYVGK